MSLIHSKFSANLVASARFKQKSCRKDFVNNFLASIWEKSLKENYRRVCLIRWKCRRFTKRKPQSIFHRGRREKWKKVILCRNFVLTYFLELVAREEERRDIERLNEQQKERFEMETLYGHLLEAFDFHESTQVAV